MEPIRYLQLWRGLGDATADKIFRAVALGEGDLLRPDASNQTLEQVVQEAQSNDDFGWTTPLLTVLLASNKPVDLVDAAFSSLEPRLSTIFQNDNWDSRKRDFEYVRELAKKHRSMAGFVDEYLLNPVFERDQERASDNDKVRIITIHSAKGLEASRCFVIDVAPGEFPRRGSTDKEVEEERRVLYVALTRAANELYITRSTRGWTQHGPNTDSDSYFLTGIPKEILAYEGRAGDHEAESSKFDSDTPVASQRLRCGATHRTLSS